MQNENDELEYEIEENEDSETVSIMELAQRQMQALLDEEKQQSKPKPDKLPPLSELLDGLEAFEASPAAMAKIQPDSDSDAANHPLGLLGIGQCYVIALDGLQPGQIARIRSAVSMWANRNGGKYAVITHKEHQILEVARIG